MASPKLKNLYLFLIASTYALPTRLSLKILKVIGELGAETKALTSINRDVPGRWKLVIRPSMNLNRYPG